MEYLYQRLAERTAKWREAGYPCDDYPAVAEVLQYQIERETGSRRFLRHAQLRALETYWYLRLVEATPHVFDLYSRLFPSTSLRLEALGLTHSEIKEYVMDHGADALWERIRTDDRFVSDFKLDALRETLTLDYASYILALAMGAGKTILIGAIIATEFAMAMEYAKGLFRQDDSPFVQNALVFAPGTTIIESLRELAEVPYDRILPPRLCKPFLTNLKLTFTRDGDPDVPVIRGSTFNVVVTNTEKIRIQKSAIRKSDIGSLLPESELDAAKEAVANRRLQAIASLPHLAVFSDEAHHTYGNKLGTDLKRVRQTVDDLHQESPNLICVINTTGTPYFQRQPLRDVVIWYGLSQGIHDGILKEVAGNIFAYEFDSDSADEFVREVVRDFFRKYGDAALPTGQPAKLALYFPQNDDLDELRPHVERALLEAGLDRGIILRNTSESSDAEIAAFNRLNFAESPHRVILLVNKGTEGWNCPSLFACALARKLHSSNNFVLQAASRCLRQVPDNNRPASIYLSQDNRAVLDRQLQESYGESLADLDNASRETRTAILRLRKAAIPPVVITQVLRRVVPKPDIDRGDLTLSRPTAKAGGKLTRTTLTFIEREAARRALEEIDEVQIAGAFESLDLYTAAVRLSDAYRVDLWRVHDELRRLYSSDGEVPLAHVDLLGEQVEEQVCRYEVHEEKVDVALALVKPEGFTKETAADGTEVYTAEIVYLKEREKYLLHLGETQLANPGEFGFHYDPYNFDSGPEKSFFEKMLHVVNADPDEVEDIYFVGALTDPGKTDFYVEYRDEHGDWRRYTPDFVIRLKDGKCLIVEIKAENMRDDPVQGENGAKAIAIQRWEELNPDRLRYQMYFVGSDVSYTQVQMSSRFVKTGDFPPAYQTGSDGSG